MKFTAKTEEELNQRSLLPGGDYDFTVEEASDEISKSGNDMIKLKLRIFDTEGDRIVFDYLLEAMAFKIKHFCEAVGLSKKYQAEELKAFDCERKSGRVTIKIQKDKEGAYPPKNVVADYVVGEDEVPDFDKKAKPEKDLDVPF